MGQAKNSKRTSTPEYEFIDTIAALTEFADVAGKADMVAVDLEADSMYHFREKVCLLQMAVNGRSVVIDPLPISDLSVLKPLFADGSICKVFHGADYDIRSLYRDYGISINNLFDTQLASMYMGLKETGLEAVVAQRFGVVLNKKYQKKDWSRRPLPDDMVAYAASDVAYLIPIAQNLISELRKKRRLAWVREECELLSRVRPSEEKQGPMFLKFKGAGRLEPRQLAMLEALLQMRYAIARQKDRPLFKVISNASLKKIAITMPSSAEGLKTCHALSKKQFEMYAEAVMKAVQNARLIPRDQLPAYPRRKSPRLSRRVPGRVNTLRTWRDRKARQLNLDPGLVLNRTAISAIAVENPVDEKALQKVEGIHQWQVKTFGKAIIKVLQNGT